MATTTLTVRLSEELFRIVVKEAKIQKLTPAEYARGNIAAGLLFDGNTEILKLAGRQLGSALRDKIREACVIEDVKEIV